VEMLTPSGWKTRCGVCWCGNINGKNFESVIKGCISLMIYALFFLVDYGRARIDNRSRDS
jgi:hypothetical protein